MSLTGALTACAEGAQTPPFSQAQADAMTSACSAPTATLNVRDGEIFLQPDSDEPYETTACVMKKLAESGQASRINANGKFASARNEGQ